MPPAEAEMSLIWLALDPGGVENVSVLPITAQRSLVPGGSAPPLPVGLYHENSNIGGLENEQLL